tara:strand:- start:2080 stop:2307 length:228 start_codon:yes stop_codon:yes gene_type:complete
MNLQEIIDIGMTTLQTKLAYASSTILAATSLAALQSIVSIIGVVLSIALAIFTAISSHRKNELQIKLLNKQLSKS